MSRHAESIQQLRQAVRTVSGCESIHHQSVVVSDVVDDIPRQYLVEVFRLIGHPEAGFAYAWRDTRRSGDPYRAVLGLPPVYTAWDAVDASAAANRSPCTEASPRSAMPLRSGDA